MDTTPETLFLTFRRTGDAAALAAAFDATAPELLRVAAFLLPRDEVEDAVHDTFVVAMTRQEKWDGQRPLLPWLLGVLANEARDRRRRCRLEARAVRPPAAVPGPVAVAQAAEVEAGLARALGELPRADAELLRLHLCEELTCREIGERLQRPAGTVRTQVSRAMGELRRRLPVGLGVGLAFGSVEASVLQSLRRRVLESGAGAAPVVAVRGVRGFMAIAAVALAAIVAVVVTRFGGEASDGASPDRASIAAAAGAPTDAGPGEAEPGISASASTSERQVSPPPAPAAPWFLRGRVHGENGIGIANAKIALRHGEFDPLIAMTRSGADGTFALDLSFWRERPALDRQRGWFVHVHARGHHAFPHFGRFPEDCRVDQPLAQELDVELGPYPTISGRVVDPGGRPVPALLMADKVDDENHSLGMAHAEADGTFLLIVASFDEVNKVRLTASHAAGAAITTDVAIHPGLDTDVGTLTLAPGHPVAGRLELADGTPVPDCEVSLRCDGVTALPDVRTDRDGRFKFCRPLPATWSAQVMKVSLCDGGIWGPKFEFAAAATDVRLSLDAALLELRWLDPDGNELLPQYAVAEVRRAGSDVVMARQNDELAWLCVPPRAQVSVTAALANGFAVAEQLVAPAGGRRRFDLKFRAVPRAPFRVELAWDDGQPVAEFECSVAGSEPEAAVGAQQTSTGPGHCEWLAPIGKVVVSARAYPSKFDGGEVELGATVTADGGGVAKVVVRRHGRIALLLRDIAAPDRIDDEFDADVQIGDVELQHFIVRDGDVETTSSEPPLGRRLDTLQLLLPGRHEVVVTADGWLPGRATVDVKADDVVDVSIWLQRK